MEKKYTVKVQKIGESNLEETRLFSIPLVIESEDEVNSKRGLLYASIEVSSATAFDPSLVLKVITDTFQSEYFHNASGTPLQALERSITSVRDKVFSLLQSSKETLSGAIEFHIVVTVLWGSVLYVVQYGDGCSYLVRENKIKPINTSSEGNFSVASGVVKEGDVVILGSKGFCEKHSPETLLANSSSLASGPLISAILLKFVTEREEVSEVVNISDSKETGEKGNSREGLLSGKFVVKRSYSMRSNKKRLILAAVFLGVALTVSVMFAFQSRGKSLRQEALTKALSRGKSSIEEAGNLAGTNREGARALLEENKKLLEEAKKEFRSPEIEKLLQENVAKLDEINKVVRVEDKVFYDLRIDDKEINPTEITTFGDKDLFVVDNTESKFVRLSFAEGPKASVVESTQAAKPKFLSPSEAGAAFMGVDGFYTIDSGNGKIEKIDSKLDFPLSEVEDSYFYIGNVYTARAGVIYKNSTSWADEESLKNAVSLVVDGDIYVLVSSGSVLKYTLGERVDYSLKGLNSPLSSAMQLYTTAELGNIYILDKGNLRVVVLDKSGNLVAQYILAEGSRSWEDARSLTVSGDGKNLFVLSGSRVYRIQL